jgi:hypothetical protein
MVKSGKKLREIITNGEMEREKVKNRHINKKLNDVFTLVTQSFPHQKSI